MQGIIMSCIIVICTCVLSLNHTVDSLKDRNHFPFPIVQAQSYAHTSCSMNSLVSFVDPGLDFRILLMPSMFLGAPIVLSDYTFKKEINNGFLVSTHSKAYSSSLLPADNYCK